MTNFRRLRRSAAVQPRRQAFTLVEMLVSLAVLALAMSIVGVVFTVTTKTASKAAAYSEAQNWVRQFTDQLEEDLRYCDPTQSPLVIAGRTIPAALTEEKRKTKIYERVLVGDPMQPLAPMQGGGTFNPRFTPSTGNPPVLPNVGAPARVNPYSDLRADVLAFWTNRSLASQAPPRVAPAANSTDLPYYAGTRFAPAQILYGHASYDDYTDNGSTQGLHKFANVAVQHIDPNGPQPLFSSVPAVRWHLVRRAALMTNQAVNGITPPTWTQFAPDHMLALARCYRTEAAVPGDVVSFDMRQFLAKMSAPANPAVVARSPYQFSNAGVWPGGAGTIRDDILSTLYVGGAAGETNYHVATLLQSPPADLASNLGLHMLPGCTWFQVEFLMPEDVRNSLDYNPDYDPVPGMTARAERPRWTEVEPDKTYVFVPDSQANREVIAQQVNQTNGQPLTGSRLLSFGRLNPNLADSFGTVLTNRRIRLWPYAIRVTVRVYDKNARLDEPIVRTVVHRFD